MQHHTEYVVRVRPRPGGTYRATVREVAPGVPLDVRTIPTGAAGIGAASTVNAAILSAFIAASLPDLSGTRRESMRSPHRVRRMRPVA